MRKRLGAGLIYTCAVFFAVSATNAGEDTAADPILDFVSALAKKVEPLTPSSQPKDLNIHGLDRQAVGSVVSPAINGFRSLGFHQDGARLKGEIDSRSWTLNLDANQARNIRVFELQFINAISVMPERSTLKMSINGKTIGLQTLNRPTNKKAIEFAIPPGVLRQGGNLVRLDASMRHRVACSVASTYELWTEIDLASSGFRTFESVQKHRQDKNLHLPGLNGLLGISSATDGSTPIHINLGTSQSAQILQESIALVSEAVLFANIDRPRLSVTLNHRPATDQSYGFDVFVGTSSQFKAAYPELAKEHKAVSHGVHLLKSKFLGRPLLVKLSGRKDHFLRSYSARQNLVQRPIVTSHSSISLSDVDFTTQEFNGRHFRASFDIDMPVDFYPADYGSAILELHAAHAPDLGKEARLNLRINGESVAGLPLISRQGQVFEGKRIEVPLRFFTPGNNRIEIEASLERQSDLVCAPSERIAPQPRFVLDAKTSLNFPRLAHMASLPNLKATLASGFPYSVNTDKGKINELVVANRHPQTIAAAASIAVHLAQRAGFPLDLNLRFGTPTDKTHHAIIVASWPDLPETIASRMPLQNKARLDEQWSRFVADTPIDLQIQDRNFENVGAEPAMDILRSGLDNELLSNTSSSDATLQRVALLSEQQRPRTILTRQYGLDKTITASVPKSVPNNASPESLKTDTIRYEQTIQLKSPASSQSSTYNRNHIGTDTDEEQPVKTDLNEWVNRLRTPEKNNWAKRMSLDSIIGSSAKKYQTLKINSDDTLILTQVESPVSSGGAWTIVTAPNSKTLMTGLDAFFEGPKIFDEDFSLGAVSFNPIDDVVTASTSPDTYRVFMRQTSFYNEVLLLAGWMSRNVWVYAIGLVSLITLFGFFTNFVVSKSGRRGQEVS